MNTRLKYFTSDDSRPEQLVARLELALVKVDGQRQDRTVLVARVCVGQDGGVKLPEGESDVVEEPNAKVTL